MVGISNQRAIAQEGARHKKARIGQPQALEIELSQPNWTVFVRRIVRTDKAVTAFIEDVCLSSFKLDQ